VYNLAEKKLIVLYAVYLACRGSTKANVSIPFIRKKIPRKIQQEINLKKTLKDLEKQGLIWVHHGRKANSGKTYGITKEGIKYLKKHEMI